MSLDTERDTFDNEGFCMGCKKEIDAWDVHECSICLMPFCESHHESHDCSEFLDDDEDQHPDLRP
jgi:predicted amidophosphoribosyltransferase